jgi:hypothetical protein
MYHGNASNPVSTAKRIHYGHSEKTIDSSTADAGGAVLNTFTTS